MSVRAFVRRFIGSPSPSAVPLGPVYPVLRPSFSSAPILPSVTSAITPVLLSRFLLPVVVSPLPLLFSLSVFVPLLLAVPLSFAVAALQRLSAGAGLRSAFSGFLHVPAVSMVTGLSGRIPASRASVPSLAGLSGLPIIAGVPRRDLFGLVVPIIALFLSLAAAFCLEETKC